MENVSNRLQKLTPSATIAMNQKSKDLQSQGIDVINLSVGEPDFFTPDHIKAAAKKAVDDNFSFYAPVPGYPELRKAISEKFKNENNLDYTPDQIVVSNGAKHSLANAMLALINPGDEVIVPAPYWVTYVELVKLAEGINVVLDTTIDDNFKVTADRIEKAITPKTKAILLCSPSNPTGAIYTHDELKAIADVVARHENIYVLSDEIYEHINFVGKHVSIAQFGEIKDRCVVINGVSKAYAMTGYRIGYMGAALWLAKACNKLQGQFTSGASSIAQRAALTALQDGLAPTMKMKEAFLRRRNLVVKLLREIDGIRVNEPDGAFYVFPDMSNFLNKSVDGNAIKNTSDLCMYLIETAHVAAVPGAAFGDPNCIRISYATSDEKLEEAMSRMKTALNKLN